MYEHGQIPLQTPARDVVEQLTVCISSWQLHYFYAIDLPMSQLTQDLRYVFPANDEFGHARLGSLGDITAHRASSTSSIIVEVPLDAALPGLVTFSSNASDSVDAAIWMSSTSHIDVEHIGIRKGGMISMPASSPTILALDSPYTALPDEIFNVLLQATETSSERNYVVDCGLLSRFPDLVFGMDAGEGGEEDEDIEVQEMVVTPQQYVLEVEGRCSLLARNAGSGRVAMGWAAFRGKKFVLDLGRGRFGLF